MSLTASQSWLCLQNGPWNNHTCIHFINVYSWSKTRSFFLEEGWKPWSWFVSTSLWATPHLFLNCFSLLWQEIITVSVPFRRILAIPPLIYSDWHLTSHVLFCNYSKNKATHPSLGTQYNWDNPDKILKKTTFICILLLAGFPTAGAGIGLERLQGQKSGEWGLSPGITMYLLGAKMKITKTIIKSSYKNYVKLRMC